MTIGVALTKAQLDNDMATVGLEVAKLLRSIDQLHEFFLITSDAALEAAAIGYTAAEVATLKTIWNGDMVTLAAVIRGQQALGAPQDFRANLFQLIGDGLA